MKWTEKQFLKLWIKSTEQTLKALQDRLKQLEKEETEDATR